MAIKRICKLGYCFAGARTEAKQEQSVHADDSAVFHRGCGGQGRMRLKQSVDGIVVGSIWCTWSNRHAGTARQAAGIIVVVVLFAGLNVKESRTPSPKYVRWPGAHVRLRNTNEIENRAKRLLRLRTEFNRV